MGDLTRNISRSELACQHCGAMEFSIDFIELLQDWRDEANIIRKELEFEQSIKIPEIGLTFISGYRCPKHDTEIGGKGAHTEGAVDIGYKNSLECWILIKAADRVGMRRIGLNNGSIHADNLTSKPYPRFWNYYKKKRQA